MPKLREVVMFDKKVWIKEWKRKYPWRKHYYKARERCSKKGKYYNKVSFNMTLENFAFLWGRDRAWVLDKPSIDRIDGNKGYSLDNCRFIEARLNNSLRRQRKINFAIAQQIRKDFALGKSTLILSKRYGISRRFTYKIINNEVYLDGEWRNEKAIQEIPITERKGR